MKRKELKILLEAQLPKSFQLTQPSVEDECDASSNNRAQPESSKTAALQGTHPLSPQRDIHITTITSPNTHTPSPDPPTPTPHHGSCASPEYKTLYVEWPFKATSRGQTSMPPSITSLINNLPTTEERTAAKQLWNRSLPISANVGIIEYNRVDEVKFRVKVGERYGEGWWRRLEDLARRLNEAPGVVVGKVKSGTVVEGKGEEHEGKALDEGSQNGNELEMKTVQLVKSISKEPEMKNSNETGGKAKMSETKTLDNLAEAAAFTVKTEEGSMTGARNSTIGESTDAQPKPDTEATEAALSLLSLSDPPAATPTTSPEKLAATNPLSALWYLIDRFFSSGPSAASYFFVALEATIRLDKPTVVHALNIPAPPAFWTDAADWRLPKVGMTLLLTLASSEKHMFDAFARFSKSLGKPTLKVEEMRKRHSASLRKAVIRAKADAGEKQRTTVLGVDLRDVRYSELCEVHGKDVEKHFATFARMFVLGICPGGAKLWLVGGEWGETATVWESNRKVGPAVGTWEEMDEFVRAFEGFAVSDGQWNTKRFKWFHRCFAVDLKQFDLRIDDAEKKKRGVQVKKEGTKMLLNEIEAWVDIYRIENVKREDVGKFSWLL